MSAPPETDRATEIRHALTDTLCASGMIASSAVERAFRAVPRERFVPHDVTLEDAYAVDQSVAIKRDAYGVIISSISAAYIQAWMIERAELGPGMRVLEIGSGGCNAALLAEVVGAAGRVVSVDIDPEVADRARARLDAAGYGDRVTVVQADAEQRVPGLDEPVDAILVTVGAWDIAPAWLEQLSQDGRLVVPLRMRGVHRTVAFRRVGEHLVSTAAEACGFVPMQGAGAVAEGVCSLVDPQGGRVTLRFDGDVPQEAAMLDGVLATECTEVWSGVTIEHGVSFADLYLWFASFLDGFCKLSVDGQTALVGERKRWFPFGAVRRDALAYLAVRPALEGPGSEFGARAHGAGGEAAAIAMVEQIQAWDRLARGGPAPTFAYWPTASTRPPVDERTVLLGKTHGRITIAWPPEHAGGQGACTPNPESEET